MFAVGRWKLLTLLSFWFAPLVVWAAEQSPARLMPPAAVAYVEVTQADLLAEKALDPALLELLNRSQGVQKYYASEQYRQSLLGVALIEARMNAKWPRIVRDLAGSLHFGFDAESNAALLILRAKNKETLAKLHATLVDLVELDATSKGKPSPVKSREYQGVTGWTFGDKEYHAVVDDLFLASNKQEGVMGLIDRLKDPSLANLIGAADYAQAKAGIAAGQVAWGLLRMDAVRQAPKLQAALRKQSNNPLVELFVGGILETLKDTPVLTGGLHVQEDQWRLRFELPRVSQSSELRNWFFAQPSAPAVPLRPQGTIASLVMNRDVAGMWIARDELFDEATRAKLAQADSGLGLYFAGRDFGTQVLGEIGPEWQFVVARQQFGEGQPTPSIKLPAAALIVQLKQPDAFASTLLLGYQKVIGLANLVGAEKGNPQLLLGGEDYQGVSISKATFLAPADLDNHAASIHYNASPSCARVGDRFIFGTTLGIVKSVLDAMKKSRQQAFSGQTLLWVDLHEAAAALDDNRPALVSQNMLKEGNSREEAEGEIGLLLTLLETIRNAGVQLKAENNSISLELTAGPK